MKARWFLTHIVPAILVLALTGSAGLSRAQQSTLQDNMGSQASLVGTGFTYQGLLKKDNRPINDTCEMAFRLYDALAGGNQIAAPITVTVPITSGLFSASLDFGAGVLTGDARWLGIRVKCTGDSSHVDLGRQPLTPAPYALALPGLWTQQNAASPNLIGGYSGNLVTGGVAGATIGGGGEDGYINQVSGSFATIGGGEYNTANGNASTIGGGWRNIVSGFASTIAGGDSNSANYPATAIGGGAGNIAGGYAATVGGGYSNNAAAITATIGGGEHISVTGQAATVAGGSWGIVSGDYATVGGGKRNTASLTCATVGGGNGNTAGNVYATVGGGLFNVADGDSATIGGGVSNTASGIDAFIGGGAFNAASNSDTFVGGGLHNTASGRWATVGGGLGNTASGDNATVGGGLTNTASYTAATVCGGFYNVANFSGSTVGGGSSNTASGTHAAIGGGLGNMTTRAFAVIGGGISNTVSGGSATVPGGDNNTALGDYSLAAGRRAKASYQGAFVWADSKDFDFTSALSDSFNIRATGGVTMVTAIDGSGNATTGAVLPAGSGAWANLSDRNLKENFTPVDGRAVLARLMQVPLSTWNYKSQDASIRHIGPMAQDFAVFGVGEDDTHISTIDADGVALAALQGLYRVVQEKDDRINQLEAQNTALQKQNADIEARLARLETQMNGTSAPVASGWSVIGLALAGLAVGWVVTRRGGER